MTTFKDSFDPGNEFWLALKLFQLILNPPPPDVDLCCLKLLLPPYPSAPSSTPTPIRVWVDAEKLLVVGFIRGYIWGSHEDPKLCSLLVELLLVSVWSGRFSDSNKSKDDIERVWNMTTKSRSHQNKNFEVSSWRL